MEHLLVIPPVEAGLADLHFFLGCYWSRRCDALGKIIFSFFCSSITFTLIEEDLPGDFSGMIFLVFRFSLKRNNFSVSNVPTAPCDTSSSLVLALTVQPWRPFCPDSLFLCS